MSGLRTFTDAMNVARGPLHRCVPVLTALLAETGRRLLPVARVIGILLWGALTRAAGLLRRLRETAVALRAVTIRVVAYGTVLIMIATVAVDLYATFAAAPAVLSEQQAEWSTVGRPYPAFALSIPELIASEPAYAIRRHNFGGGRRHIMTFGEPESDRPSALVEVYRPGAESARFGDPVAAMAALVADLGASRPAAAEPLPDTKFGQVDLVDFSIGGQRRCTGFVRSVAEPRFQIAGWFCNGGPELVDRSTIACMLDRLTVISAASDPTLTEFFGRAALRRNFCSHKAARVAAARQHTDWIEAESAPELRGRLSTY